MIDKTISTVELAGNYHLQDTTKQVPFKVPVINILNVGNSNDTVKNSYLLNTTLSEQNIDSIFKRHEEREMQYQQEMRLLQIKRWSPKIDTAKLFYENLGFYNNNLVRNLSEDPFQQNFLLNIIKTKKQVETKSTQVFISNKTGNEKTKYFIEKKIDVKPLSTERALGYDWVSWILILSFILLGWVRLFFYNQFNSVIRSLVSYQESNGLYRERNIIVDRVFLLLNILFLLVTSVFATQIANFYKVGAGHYHLFFGLVFLSLAGLFLFRYITSSFIGLVFLKQGIFSEYIHNVNIYTMSTGVFLLPVIILLQYLSFEYLDLIVYLGIGGIVLLYVSQLFRSFQIIIRKNVSVFYMILYLCAFEFAPFLIVYKLLLSLN